eukprot:CCRYP_012015-RA/>CCRYP_012015-RA protein AED:0.11 eAED:0.11 QI:0/-1/0/1/-1/1/1/0/394
MRGRKKTTFLLCLALPLAYNIFTAFTLDLSTHHKEEPREVAFTRKERQKKYLYYYSHSGFSNQLFGLANAAQLAYYTNRTLILPPILEHNVRIAGPGCAPYEKSVEFIETAKRDAKNCRDNPNEHEAFEEIVDIEKISNATGVEFIDLKDFMTAEPKLLSEYFLGNSARLLPLIDFRGTCTLNYTRSFPELVEYFQSIFANDTVAIIPSAFFMPQGNFSFIRNILAAQPSPKLLSLFRNIRDRMHSSRWDNFIGVHLRFRDRYEFSCQTENATGIIGQIQNASLSMIEKNETDRSPSVFFASSVQEANKCYKQILGQAGFVTFDLSDLLIGDVTAERLSEIFHVRKIIILPLLDQIMVSLGKRVVFSGQMTISTFQSIIRIRHKLGCKNIQGFC